MDEQAAPSPEDEAAARRAIDEAQRDAVLQADHDLVRLRAPVYVLDQAAARKRSGSAERMARKRERDRQAAEAAGMARVVAQVPRELAAQIEAAGGLPAWLATKATTPAPAEKPAEKVVEKVVEKVIEKPARLSDEDRHALAEGRRLQALTGWRRLLARWALAEAKR